MHNINKVADFVCCGTVIIEAFLSQDQITTTVIQ